MIDSREFAKYIIYASKEKNIEMNMTKLQKFLYICDGLLLALGHNVIKEKAKAWDYGPVYPRVYKWYKDKVGKPVDKSGIDISAVREIEDNHYNIIVDKVLGSFGTWTARQLSTWTHQSVSPWSNAVRNSGGELYGEISKEDMSLFFAGVLNVK